MEKELLPVLASVWTVQILRTLAEKSRHFSRLKRDLTGISAKVLSSRLRTLESRGIVERRVIPSSPPMVQYLLTDLGFRVCSVLTDLNEVSVVNPGPQLVSAQQAG
jgi:DNA-binding HxlR family transcriptional regulator